MTDALRFAIRYGSQKSHSDSLRRHREARHLS